MGHVLLSPIASREEGREREKEKMRKKPSVVIVAHQRNDNPPIELSRIKFFSVFFHDGKIVTSSLVYTATF